MTVLLVVWIQYSSLMAHYGYAGLTTEKFETVAECHAAGEVVRNIIGETLRNDTFTISCEIIKK